MFKFKRILCPIDFSAASSHALDFAISLAIEHEATLFPVHVIEEIGFTSPVRLSAFPASLDYHPGDEERVKARLEAMVCPQLKRQIKVEEIVAKGKAFRELIRIAREKSVDLIVLPTHSHGGAKHSYLGLTADRLAREAPCAILLVRYPTFHLADGEKESVAHASSAF
jgi:nucleotide-binding universal stress UspA family protein